MHLGAKTCAGVFTLLLSSTIFAQQPQDILHNTLNDYILPGYTQVQNATGELTQQIAELCEQPNQKRLSNAKEAFYATVDAWSSVEWFRVGSVLDDNRVERFLFFPDRKGTGLRQVRTVLAKQNPAVLDVEKLQKMSVALQGLGALDFILFDDNATNLQKQPTFRCQFASSISKNLHQIATRLVGAWTKDIALRNHWTQPSQTNPLFRTDKEAMNLIIGTLIHGLEAIRDTRIAVFLRTEPGRDRPKSAAFWRSAATLPSIQANLTGLEQLFNQSRIEGLLSETEDYLGDTLRFEFQQSIQTAKALDKPVSALLADPNQRQKLEYLKLTLNFLIDRLNNEFAPATGLAAGFSFGDGD